MRRFLAFLIFTALLPVGAYCQSPVSKTEFDVADVHVSPRDLWVKTSFNAMRIGMFSQGRYEIRRATMLDLIRIAWSVDAGKVFGGPAWLDYDRYEVIAKAPSATTPPELRLMLQSLLANRFNLVVRADWKLRPAWLLSVGKRGPKLKHADGSGSAGCESPSPTSIHEMEYPRIRCRNVTLTTFAASLRGLVFGYVGNLPLVDITSLEDTWDIDLQYSALVKGSDASSDDAALPAGNIFESVLNQLGLTLERGEARQAVLVVERVDERPAANPPGLDVSLSPLPSPEFEVASIKPCDRKGPSTSPRFLPGGRVTAHCWSLMGLIAQAWGLAPYQDLPGAPKWLTKWDGPSFSIDAKSPKGNFVDAAGAQDRDALNAMIRALLLDRFKLAVHYEDRPMDAWTLVAAKPKLTRADPAARTGCTEERRVGVGGGGLPVQLDDRSLIN
jgi:uncharacterized protein (TIGR03435 family)